MAPLFVLVPSQEAYAAAKSWDGGGQVNSWHDCDNWSGNECPSGNDVITIGSGYSVYIADSNFVLDSGGSLTVGAGASLALVLDDLINKGTIHNVGTIEVDHDDAVKLENQGTIFNDGTIESEGAIINEASGKIQNNAGALFNTVSGGNIANLGTIINKCGGTVTIEGGLNGNPIVYEPCAIPCEEPTKTGTDGADVIEGTSGVDIIDAKGGDDKINGLGGNDIICGDGGNDSISGGAGSDLIFGGHGNDIINGGLGNDELNGGAGNDSISGNGGNDKLLGSSGNDVLNAKDGVTNNDSIDGGFGTDTCTSNPDPEISCEISSTGLVAHWRFDESSGTKANDSSGNGNSGSLVNEPSWLHENQCALGDSCLDFDGINDYVRVSRSSTLEPTNAITITMWVNADAPRGALIDKAFTSHTYPFYSYNLQLEPKSSDPTKAELIWSITTNGVWKFMGEGVSEVLVDLNSWQFISVVYDGSQMREYVNGDLKASSPKSGPITYYDKPLLMGKYNNLGFFTDTAIDDARIFDRALSNAEIQQLFQEGQ